MKLALWFVSAVFSGSLLATCLGLAIPELINGVVVPAGQHLENVRIVSAGKSPRNCGGVLVGPRAVLTAASCGNADSDEAEVEIDRQRYPGKRFSSPLYPKIDHDLAVVVLENEVPGTWFANIGGTTKVGMDVVMFGHGCTKAGGPFDGILRMSRNEITGYQGLDFISGPHEGAATLCAGDAGSPGYIEGPDGKWNLVGIASKGNMKDRSFHVRLDTEESREFLDNVISHQELEMCGINKVCP